jgi:hypothetical protein
MLIIHLYIKSHIPNSDGSLDSAVKKTDKYRRCLVTMLFYFVSASANVHFFLHKFLGHRIKWT